MDTVPRFFLKKEHKLKSRKAIAALFTSGHSFTYFPLRVCWLAVHEAGVKAGFTCSSRVFKHATDRNKIKRLLREAYRLQKNELVQLAGTKQQGLHVFFMYTHKQMPTYAELHAKMQKALARLQLTIHEKD